MNLKEVIYYLAQIPGSKIRKKIVVIESDDWGSIRMPSLSTRESLRKEGVLIDSNPFNLFDALEMEGDYVYLMQHLDGIREIYNKSPVITANFIMTNPKFEFIAENNFESYDFELFTETYQQRDHSDKTILAMKAAIDGAYIRPQFHGREHLNVNSWLSLIKNNHRELSLAFRNKTYAIDFVNPSGRSSNLMAAFDYEDEAGFEFVRESIKQGYSLFADVFGFKSKSIVAPCHVWDERHEKIFEELGIQFIQSSLIQLLPKKHGYKKKFRYLGSKSQSGQRYLVRNIFFEPTTLPSYPWIEKTLRKAKLAFAAHKPLIISMHRINFSTGIETSNRDQNVELLIQLIEKLIQIYPDIEFMSSDQLGLHLVQRN
jgi:hypothetical protein